MYWASGIFTNGWTGGGLTGLSTGFVAIMTSSMCDSNSFDDSAICSASFPLPFFLISTPSKTCFPLSANSSCSKETIHSSTDSLNIGTSNSSSSFVSFTATSPYSICDFSPALGFAFADS
jgi:hypothetical protein